MQNVLDLQSAEINQPENDIETPYSIVSLFAC